MALDFPITPDVDDIYTSGDMSWIWDGVSWIPLDRFPLATEAEMIAGVSTTKVPPVSVAQPYIVNVGLYLNGLMQVNLESQIRRNRAGGAMPTGAISQTTTFY